MSNVIFPNRVEDVTDSAIRKRQARVPRMRGNDGDRPGNQHGRFTINGQLKAPLQKNGHLLVRVMVFWRPAARGNAPKRERHVGGMKHSRQKAREHFPRRGGFKLIKLSWHLGFGRRG